MELSGQRFGNIHVASVVGQGGMGDVYEGYDAKLERKVALKVLNEDQRLDGEARERLLREARALSKLDHPNICRIYDYIESGTHDLLILEFIDGQTLGDVIREGKLPRSEKLRIAIAVAGVLVAAHRAGIVHRDLKPENVMLTRSGEVKVLDFGLARWLYRTQTSPSSATPLAQEGARRSATIALPAAPDETAPRATAAGVALGSPLYMSPEQARGETLTPASDMFSFGLLLQELFTGNEPHPLGLSAREVILRVALGETNPVEGVDRDITAIINRLKQYAATDRPTAVETIERLQFIIDKPRRIARRGAVAALITFVAFGGWRYTADLQTERAKAIASEAEAQRRRAQAENLIEFMLGDLRTKLKPVGRLEIMDDVAASTLRYVESVNVEKVSAEELVLNAKAINQLVETRLEQVKIVEALDLARRSLHLTQIAARREPDDPDVQLALATSHFWMGATYRRQSDVVRAMEHMTAYMRATRRLAENHPANDSYQLERAYGQSVVATMLEAQGKLQDALVHLVDTHRVKSARVAAHPQDASRRADLAVTDNRIGYVLHRLGDFRGARKYFESELAAYRSLNRADPSNAVWQEHEARSRSYMALALESVGEVDAAIEHVRSQLAIESRLADLDPANANWQRNLTNTHIRLASLLHLKGESVSSLQHLEQAERELRARLSREVHGQVWKRCFASMQVARARVHRDAGNAKLAASALKSAHDELEELDADPGSRMVVAEAEVIQGDLIARTDPAAARAFWESAESRLAGSPAATTEPQILQRRATALLRLGRVEDAAAILTQLQQSGYRHPEFIQLQQRVPVRLVTNAN